MQISELQVDMIRTELEDIVGPEHVVVSDEDRTVYGVDYFWVSWMLVDRGKIPPRPAFVVYPNTVEEVSRIVKLANIYRLPVIPWGGGSGSQGGVLAVYGGITVDLKRLNRLIQIDEKSLTVTAQAGINGQELEWALNEKGYTLPHYPASQFCATLGGYLAPRGSGVLSTKYGKAEDMVLSLQVVLPNGDIIRTLPVPNHAAGPSILQLFVGSEGTLGIITEATMQIEHLPEERRFRAFLFEDLHAGLEAGRKIMTRRLQPAVIRLYDYPSTRKRIKKVLGLDLEGYYMVLGYDGYPDVIDPLERRALEIIKEEGGEDLGPELGWHWWKHRYDFYFPPNYLWLPWLFGTMDTVCTYDKIENLYWNKKRVIEEGYKDWGVQYIGHFSHWYPWGVMVYDRFIIEEPPKDPYEALRLHNEIWNVAVRTSMQYGGVINEHHGVGLKLARLMREQYGPAFQVLEGIKNALDPHHLFNPGKQGFGPPK